MASLLEHVNARIDDLHTNRPLWSHAQGTDKMTHKLIMCCIVWSARLTL